MKIQVRTNAQAATGTALGSVDIPDTALTALQQVFKGATSAETAQNALNFILRDGLHGLRHYVQSGISAAETAKQAGVTSQAVSRKSVV